MQNRDKLFIDGRWAAPSGKTAIDVINASTEAVMGRIPEGDAADVAAAVAAARRAFDGWAATPVAERAAFLKKIQEGLKARSDDIARTIAGEVGMPLKLSAMIQAGSPIGTFGMYSRMLGDFAFEEKVGHSLVVREPIGVVAAITPWNYPLHQIAAKVAPALAAGCTVVLKPSEVAPLNAFILAEVIDAAGLPAGVFNLVTGTGPVVGEAMVTHPEVDMVSFTGSTRAGKRVSELASQTVKRVALELGGKSAAVILDDADFAAAVRGTVNACFLNSGQTCTAHTRMLVPESRYAEAAKLAVEAAAKFTVGDPFAETSKLGPLISASQRDRVRDFIRKGIAEGAELLCGGPDAPAGLSKGYYVQPTVFGRVKPGSTIEQEEIFGPVLSIIAYKDEDEAARIANGTPYGLAGAAWAGSDERAIAFARRMRTGQVDINGGAFNALAPFGGYKQSGNGRELGKYGLEEFLEYKALQFKANK
ncbi:MAG: betaine-aldehyde dehydrogenase [Rhodocyclaceae bacterium]|uniref:Aldehyde dehydrogenase family protein n=1 Tax=Candidatus Desulfobacillus denitrificans TaxID=2608985 RepID=A0A809R1Q5_9PROT|nr:aldehyde dehydrogenase family protein [Candidatus Desulfobacillus denitrificans]GIK44246.1 MAG: betaine-aldehyde dehydrogenase [Betaproteobacteria bacterium]GJQ55213.1 MAG: betaine-aldehyde dehydrogenase [Rhodocyclaceae bacterium]